MKRASAWTIHLPNGSTLEINRRKKDGVWTVDARLSGRGAFATLLRDSTDFEFAEWFAPIAIQSEEAIPAELLDLFHKAEKASRNVHNVRKRTERDSWLVRARSIEFLDREGTQHNLTGAMSVVFGPDGAIRVEPADQIDAWFYDANERDPTKVAELQRVVEEIACGLKWHVITDSPRPGYTTYINAQARWLEFRESLLRHGAESS